MKKIIVLAFLGLLAPCAAQAQSQPTTAVAEAYQSTSTCYAIQVSSYSGKAADATQIINSTGTLWRNALLQNDDTSTATYCAPWNTSVSSATAATFSSNIGLAIWPAAATPSASPPPTRISLYPGELLYCVNGSVGGSSKQTVLEVCLGR